MTAWRTSQMLCFLCWGSGGTGVLSGMVCDNGAQGVLVASCERKAWSLLENPRHGRWRSSLIAKENYQQVSTCLRKRELCCIQHSWQDLEIWRELWHQTWGCSLQIPGWFLLLDPGVAHSAPFPSFWNTNAHLGPLCGRSLWPASWFSF